MQSAGDLDVQYVCQEWGTLGELEEVLLVELESLGEEVLVEFESFGRGGVGGRVGEVVLVVELESLEEVLLVVELESVAEVVLVVELERWCWW